MVKTHADSNLTPKFLGSILIWKGQVPFQRNHSRFSWCFTCQATFGNFDPYEAQVVDQVAAAFGYGLNNKDEGYFYSNNQVRVEPEEVVKLKTWSWSHLGWCFLVELQRPDEQLVFTMAWSLWFFPVLILVAAVLYFLSLMFFLILHIFWFGWRVEFADLMGLFQTWNWSCGSAGIQFPRGRVQHCCTPPREFGRIGYLMGNLWLQRQLFSQKAVEACWGYKWAQQVYSSISFWWCFLHNEMSPLEFWQVFKKTELLPICRKLWNLKSQGKPCVLKETLEVLPNNYWGIVGGYEVRRWFVASVRWFASCSRSQILLVCLK